MNNWVNLAILGGLSSNIFHFVTRKAVKDQDSTAFMWWFKVFKVGIFFSLLWFDHWIIFSLSNLLILLGFGLVEIVALYLFGKMHRLTDLSISSIVSRLRLVWLPMFAFVFLRERLSSEEYLGIGLIFLGAIVTAITKNMKIGKEIQITFVFSLVAAGLSVFMKKAAEIASTPVVMMFMDIPSLIFLPVLMKSPKIRIVASYREKIKDILIFTAASSVAMYLLTEALRLGPASKVVSLYQSMMIISVLLGIVVLKEKKGIVNKLVGTGLTIGGIWLLVG